MTKSRVEAFSDGVIAILITIMVLELKVPHGHEWSSLAPVLPIGLAYVLSFVLVGIYWNNHHHMLHATERIGGGVLWANLHLLFWLSLIPFATHWMGESGAAPVPTAAYGAVQLACAIAYTVLQGRILAHQRPASKLHEAVGRDFKGKLSLASYAAAIPLAFVHPWIAIGLFVFVALLWLTPDPRIERRLES